MFVIKKQAHENINLLTSLLITEQMFSSQAAELTRLYIWFYTSSKLKYCRSLNAKIVTYHPFLFQTMYSLFKRLYVLFVLLCIVNTVDAQKFSTVFEQSQGKQTATYQELIAYYKTLSATYPTLQLQEVGATDTHYPLHIVYYSQDQNFSIRSWKEEQRIILLINNGIHPGEPDGIDASMQLLRDAAQGKLHIPKQIVLAVVPVFNIGGMLNRGSYSRANQNGPQSYGFRGNAQNLDLNRDFIKMDAQETKSLVRLMRALDPDIFIDNHVSNGADYQHVMTLLSPNNQKLGKHMGAFLNEVMEPELYQEMKLAGYDLAPYVNHWGDTPDKGWTQFYDPPRFTSGYAALFQTFAFVPEAHMLKPYAQRVAATYALMKTFINLAATHQQAIKQVRQKERNYVLAQKDVPLNWVVDTTKFTTISFKGYKAKYKPSEVSGKLRLYYDRSMHYTLPVPFYNYFKPTNIVSVPRYYVLPQGWKKVIARLKTNGVQMMEMKKDTVIHVVTYKIQDYKTTPKPYEGHYLHTGVTYETITAPVPFRKGDFLISTQQIAKRYLIETLEPNAPDAFFAWNFFDAVLQQKEYFSDYVFEDEAAQLLKQNPALRSALNSACKADTTIAQSAQKQLAFIYQHSPYQEPEYLRYPVFRIE